VSSINDWAAKAARRINRGGFGHDEEAREERIAAIIATFAEPLVALLRESYRGHYHCENDNWHCCGKCVHECTMIEDGELGHEHDESCCVSGQGYGRVNGVCNCGADAWNAKVDKALGG
jgi:hypothetical protein